MFVAKKTMSGQRLSRTDFSSKVPERVSQSKMTKSTSKKTLPESTAFIVWGPPGAGKSTLIDVYPPETIFKNIDDIVNFHFHPTTSNEYWKSRKAAETVATDKYLNHLAVSQHKNLAVETTGNWYGPSWAADLMRQGFDRVVVLCVFVNGVDEVWSRVRRRDQLSVDYPTLVDTYHKAYYENMQTLLADNQISNVIVFDNSTPTLQLLFAKHAQQVNPVANSVPQKSEEYRQWLQTPVSR